MISARQGRPRIDRPGRFGDTLPYVRLLALTLILIGLAAPAEAGFGVCNKTDRTTDVALGYHDGKGWGSAGWWTLPPGSCSTLLTNPLHARYYYLYAIQHDIGGGWDGEHGFCVRGTSFRIQGNGDCTKRGFDRKGFFEIDTGQAIDWTQNLAD